MRCIHNNSTIYTSNEDKANTFALHFAEVNSNNYYTKVIQKRKENIERNHKIVLQTKFLSPTIRSLSIKTYYVNPKMLLYGIKIPSVSASQEMMDLRMKFMNIFLQTLSEYFLNVLTLYGQRSCTTTLKNAVFLPFHKPGKDPNSIDSYIPTFLSPSI